MDCIEKIENHSFPQVVVARFKSEVLFKFGVELSDDAIEASVCALKDFFIFCCSTDKEVGMPSVLADELWHAYLLFTREYDAFCKHLGRFIHHAPVVERGRDEDPEKLFESTLRCFVMSCQREGLNPFESDIKPLLFLLDDALPSKFGNHFDLTEMKEKLIKTSIKSITI